MAPQVTGIPALLFLTVLPMLGQGDLIRTPEMDKILAPDAKVEKVAGGLGFTEGPVWDRKGGFLFFSDMPANAMMTWSPAAGVSVHRGKIFEGEFPAGTNIGTNGLSLDKKGRIVAAEHGDRRVVRFGKDRKVT